jgi:hypothetical protein
MYLYAQELIIDKILQNTLLSVGLIEVSKSITNQCFLRLHI